MMMLLVVWNIMIGSDGKVGAWSSSKRDDLEFICGVEVGGCDS